LWQAALADDCRWYDLHCVGPRHMVSLRWWVTLSAWLLRLHHSWLECRIRSTFTVWIWCI